MNTLSRTENPGILRSESLAPLNPLPGINRPLLLSLLALCFLGLPWTSKAQPNGIAPSSLGCGTLGEAERAQQVYAYQQLKPNLKLTDYYDTIPLHINLVGASDGSGIFPLPELFRALCELNEAFEPVGLYFYIGSPIRHILSDRYYIHETWAGFDMINRNQRNQGVNVYVVQDPAGTCGYFTPSSPAIVLRKSCLGAGSSTFAHEMGHFLGLPHTFYGWENGGVPWQAELVDRVNCLTAGDGFCDTEADYLYYRWHCPYSGTLQDALGTPLKPDSSLIMSYVSDFCAHRFSDEQTDYMRYYRSRYDFGSQPHPHEAPQSPVQIISPKDYLYLDNRLLVWESTPGATGYFVKITQKLSGKILYENLVSDTSLKLNFSFVHQNLYTIYIQAISEIDLCQEGTRIEFTYLNQSTHTPSVEASAMEDWSLFPNPVGKQGLKIQWGSLPFGSYEWKISNMLGQVLEEGEIDYAPHSSLAHWPTYQLSPGIHYLYLVHRESGWKSSRSFQVLPSSLR